MNEYTPAYLDAIQNDLAAILAATDRAAETIDHSAEYQNHGHPFHAAAVATYNRLVSVSLDLEKFKTAE